MLFLTAMKVHTLSILCHNSSVENWSPYSVRTSVSKLLDTKTCTPSANIYAKMLQGQIQQLKKGTGGTVLVRKENLATARILITVYFDYCFIPL